MTSKNSGGSKHQWTACQSSCCGIKFVWILHTQKEQHFCWTNNGCLSHIISVNVVWRSHHSILHNDSNECIVPMTHAKSWQHCEASICVLVLSHKAKTPKISSSSIWQWNDKILGNFIKIGWMMDHAVVQKMGKTRLKQSWLALEDKNLVVMQCLAGHMFQKIWNWMDWWCLAHSHNVPMHCQMVSTMNGKCELTQHSMPGMLLTLVLP